jgi:putative transposase
MVGLSAVTQRALVTALRDEYPVQLLCAVLGLAPSTYYYQPLERDDLSLLVSIEDVLRRFPTYGYRRVTAQLQREQLVVNHKRVHRVMRENDLLVAPRRGVRTTQSDHPYGRYPNRLQGLQVERPDQVWCADITYICLPRSYVYLAIVLDVYTRSLRGWYLGRTLSSELALTALRNALARHQPEIHHSDQGVQYAARGYVHQLEAVGAQLSMAARGQPTQNPYAERVIRTIKEEEVYLNEYPDYATAYREIGHFIEHVYQTKRIHSALGYLTPTEFEAAYRQKPVV